MTETEILTAEIKLLRAENQKLREHLKEAEEMHATRLNTAMESYKAPRCPLCSRNERTMVIRANYTG